MLLEGHGRRKESTGVLKDASTPEQRKENRAQAEAIYHARMNQLAREKVGLPIDSRITFSSFATWYLKHHTAKHASAPSERSLIATLLAYFGPMRLTEIHPNVVTEYDTARRKTGVKVSTRHREITLLKTMLTRAIGQHLSASPLAHYSTPAGKVVAKRTLSGSEEPPLLDALRALDPDIADLYLVGVGTLLRQSNIVHLQRKDYRGDHLALKTKTGPHTVNLTGPTELQTRAAAVLEQRMPSAHAGYFFPALHQRFATSSGARAQFLRTVRDAVESCGHPWGLERGGLVWHTLTRASGATRLIREYGVDVRTVQLMGPWSSLDQMMVYLGLPSGHQTGTMHALSRHLK